MVTDTDGRTYHGSGTALTNYYCYRQRFQYTLRLVAQLFNQSQNPARRITGKRTNGAT